MKLEWYLWIALVACACFFLNDCRIFYRKSSRGDGFGWLNLAVMFGELAVVVWLVVKGASPPDMGTGARPLPTARAQRVVQAPRPELASLVGNVMDERGAPLAGARAAVAGVSGVSDRDGRFELWLPADTPEGDLTIIITAAGFESRRYRVVLGGGPLGVMLHHPEAP
jgi:hypothetical protein